MFWRLKRLSAGLAEKLEQWKKHAADYPEPGSELAGIAAPPGADVTSHSIRAIVGWGRFMKVAFLNQLLAVAVCGILNIPGTWYVCSINLLAVVSVFAPFLFYKEPSSVEANREAPIVLAEGLQSEN